MKTILISLMLIGSLAQANQVDESIRQMELNNKLAEIQLQNQVAQMQLERQMQQSAQGPSGVQMGGFGKGAGHLIKRLIERHREQNND